MYGCNLCYWMFEKEFAFNSNVHYYVFCKHKWFIYSAFWYACCIRYRLLNKIFRCKFWPQYVFTVTYDEISFTKYLLLIYTLMQKKPVEEQYENDQSYQWFYHLLKHFINHHIHSQKVDMMVIWNVSRKLYVSFYWLATFSCFRNFCDFTNRR